MLVDYGLPACFRRNDDAFFHQSEFYKAPELLGIPEGQEEIPTTESDVFALGIIFYEVWATVLYYIQV